MKADFPSQIYIELASSGELPKDSSEMWDKLMFRIICVMVLLVPLAMWPPLSSTYDLPKAALLWIGAAVLMVAMAGQFLWTKSPLTGSFRSPSRYLEWALLAGLLGLGIVATALSVDPVVSIFGKYGRYDGLLTLGAGIAVMVAAMQINWSARRLAVLSILLVSGAAVSGLYGLMQTMGWDPVQQTYLYTAGRSAGTFGNPSLLAPYLVFALPISLTLVIRYWDRHLAQRIAASAAFLIVFSATVMTLSRGGWIGAAVAVAFWLFMVRRYVWTRKAQALLLASLALLLVIGLALFSTAKRPELNLITRTVSSAQVSEGSIGIRIETWRAAASAIAERPLFGWGPDTFGMISTTFETKRFVSLAGNVAEDNAHNDLLQSALGSGVFAPVIFVILLLLFIRRGFSGTVGTAARAGGQGREIRAVAAALMERRATVVDIGGQDDGRLKKKIDQALATHPPDDLIEAGELYVAALTAAGIGYFVAVLTTVDPVGSSFLMLLAFGVISALVPTGEQTRFRLPLGARLPEGARIGTLAITGLAASAVLTLGVLWLVADAHFNEGSRLENMGYLQAATDKYESAIRFNPIEARYHRSYGRALVRSGLELREPALVKQAIAVFEEERDKSPRDLNNYMFAGQAYLASAEVLGSPSNLSRAVSHFHKATKLRPHSAEAWSFLAAAYFSQDKVELARTAAQRSISLYPDGQAYYYLGRISALEGKGAKARHYYELAIQNDPSLSEARTALDELRP